MGRAKTPPLEYSRIEMAQYLNTVLNVTVITPWGLGEIPEHWIEFIVEAESLKMQLAKQNLLK